MSNQAPQQFSTAPQQNPQPVAQPGMMSAPYRHPQEQTVMILAIVGIFTGITAPFAWYIGSKAKQEMISQGMEPTSGLKTWTTVGMVLTILFAVGVVLEILIGIVFIGAIGSLAGTM